MSFKKLLGLEDFPLPEREIFQKLEEARRNNLKEIEFSFDQRRVRVKVNAVSPEGLMREYQDYYLPKN